LHVVFRRVEARPDSADHLAVNDNWEPALHLGEALRGNGRNTTVVDRVFECLTRPMAALALYVSYDTRAIEIIVPGRGAARTAAIDRTARPR
jgi:hypothetical protein